MKANSKVTTGSLLIALGIIYGDIGTSPLYALRAVIGNRAVDMQLVYGGVSCIFWTLVFQTTLKYVVLTLNADNDGEGGIFSLFAAVKSYGKRLAIPAMLGATALLADGIITPPISVASAIEGLAMVPGLEHTFISGSNTVVYTVIALLSLLFFFQRFGTQIIGKAFGPIMFLWFLMLMILGGNQVIQHPQVIWALHPKYAYDLLVHYPQGFWLLGAVFLCTTGAEALYSDLGHCGKKNIRFTWVFVKISLVTCYLGQAAWLMQNGSQSIDTNNPFFEIVPHWFLLPAIIIATMATIIASQALISGSFTLISEAMNLNCWPRVATKQPSDIKGQIYIPSINNLLWFGCILMIIYFRESSHMEAAYGFSITVAMLMTSILLGYFLRYKLQWSPIIIIIVMAVFATVELSFFIANVAKIKERWMFLFFELFIFLTMYVWHSARRINNGFTKFMDLGKYAGQLKTLSADESIPKFSTHLIYLTKANNMHEVEDKIISSIFSKKPKRADVYWFVHINRTMQPYTLTYRVAELVDDVVIKIDINVGFRIQPKTELYFKKVVQDLVAKKELNLHIHPDGSTKYNPEPDFKFVVLEKFLSIDNEFALSKGLLLSSYFFLKRLGQSDERAFGLDRSDVVVEQIPLVYYPISQVQLTRLTSKY